MQGVAEKR
ncbi:hypothetical protein LTT89_24655 [Escherichia coli]|nr:hypothetical protein [Escherichia coli]MCN5406663.1 hypothetical protein [Escherichia coli]